MKLQINIDGKQYEADIEVLEEERHEPVGASQARSVGRRMSPAMGHTETAAVPGAGVSDDKACKSTIVGIVVTVLAKVGQDVHVGEPLLVLEAMKMESNIVSTIAGRVKSVCVKAGESVKKGQVLIEFE
jgi:biotin carboxyl carrier protein